MVGGSPDFAHEVRSAADIGRLIADYVPLKKAGRKLKGLCPFHTEKTPSFTVDPEKQLFYCFGCQTGGDAFKFLMLIERLEFPDALRQLATRFGVPIPKHSRRDSGEAERLMEMHREATAFYVRALASRAGDKPRDYLRRRGLGKETVQKLSIGYAPAPWEALKAHLRKSGYSEGELIDSGLAVPGKKGSGSYDRFRNRVVFPIERVGGGIIGFGGRVLDDSQPKYLNSPDTPIFNKGRQLYGLSWSREEIRQQESVFIVEGYMDFAALWEAGVRNVVAVLGTGFTREHGRLLGRFVQRAVINFDADTAGRKAADRAASVLLDQDFDVRVLVLPDGLDPDDFIRQHGADAYRDAAGSALSFVDFLLETVAVGHDVSQPEGKARAAAAILPRLAEISSHVLRAAALARVADRFGVPEEALHAEFRRLTSAQPGAGRDRTPAARRTAPVGKTTLAEKRLLHLLLADGLLRDQLAQEATEEDFNGLATQPIFAAILGQHKAGHPISVESLQTMLPEGMHRNLLEIAVSDFPGLVSDEGESCWRALRKEKLERDSRRVQRQLQEGKEIDGGRMDELLRRKLELRRMIDALS